VIPGSRPRPRRIAALLHQRGLADRRRHFARCSRHSFPISRRQTQAHPQRRSSPRRFRPPPSEPWSGSGCRSCLRRVQVINHLWGSSDDCLIPPDIMNFATRCTIPAGHGIHGLTCRPSSGLPQTTSRIQRLHSRAREAPGGCRTCAPKRQHEPARNPTLPAPCACSQPAPARIIVAKASGSAASASRQHRVPWIIEIGSEEARSVMSDPARSSADSRLFRSGRREQRRPAKQRPRSADSAPAISATPRTAQRRRVRSTISATASASENAAATKTPPPRFRRGARESFEDEPSGKT